MNRYRQYGQRDDVPEVVGDDVLNALDMYADPAELPPGTVRLSENFRFNQTGAQVRGGIARQLPAGTALPEIRWAAVYRPDGGNDRLALVTAGALYLFNPADQSLATHNFPGGETVAATDPVDFIQGGLAGGTTRTAYILRGQDKSVLKFDGSAVTVDAAFERGDFGIFYQDRMVVNAGSQSVAVSDFLDFATWSVLNQFKILEGSDDELVGLLPFQKDYVIIFTRKRVFIGYFQPSFTQAGYAGGLNNESWLRELTRQAGALGKQAFLEANGRIWVMSDRGIFAFVPQLDLNLTVLGDPISTPIQPVMQEINATAALNARMTLWNDRIYVTFPRQRLDENGEPLRGSVSTVTDLSVDTDGVEVTSLALTLTAPVGGDQAESFFFAAGAYNSTQADAEIYFTNTPASPVTDLELVGGGNVPVGGETVRLSVNVGLGVDAAGTVAVAFDGGATTTVTLAFADNDPADDGKTASFTLPASVGEDSTVTIVTLTSHGLLPGDTVTISGSMVPGLNGTHTVATTPDADTFTVTVTGLPPGTTAADFGNRLGVVKHETRNNVIAVYNLNLQKWESIDRLPAGLYADWLVVADYQYQRRLWLIDRDNGPAVYEEGSYEETTDTVGGLTLPFTLPAYLSEANFQSVPLAGRLVSRSFRWGPFPRHVRAVEARLKTGTGDAGSMTAIVRTPDRGQWESSRTWDDTNADTSARKRCGKRGLEAEIEIATTAGRPVVRSLGVEFTASGRVAEE